MAQWHGSVKIDAVPTFRQLGRRFQLVHDDYRMQIQNRRERVPSDVDLAVIRTEGPTHASSSFLVELYPSNLFSDFTSDGPDVDFRLDNEDLNRALSEVTKREAEGTEKPIYIFLQYEQPKLSFLKMVAAVLHDQHFVPTDRRPVQNRYEVELANMPNRFVQLNKIENMYQCLKGAEDHCMVAQVIFRNDECEVTFGPGLEALSRTFHVTRRSGNTNLHVIQSSIVINKFTRLYESLPLPKPDLYYDGREFVEEMMTGGGDLIARVRYRFQVPAAVNLGLGGFQNPKFSGDVKHRYLPVLRKLRQRFDCFPSHYRFQIYNRRADVLDEDGDVVVIKTEDEGEIVNCSFQVEVFSSALLKEHRLQGGNVDFRLNGEELSRALSGVLGQNAVQPEKDIYIRLQFGISTLSFYKWFKTDDGRQDVALTDPQPAQDHYEVADLPDQYVQPEEIVWMHALLEEIANYHVFVQVAIYDDLCVVIHGTTATTFPMWRLSSAHRLEVESTIHIGSFRRLYESFPFDRKPDLYYDGHEFVEDISIAIARYRFEVEAEMGFEKGSLIARARAILDHEGESSDDDEDEDDAILDHEGESSDDDEDEDDEFGGL